MTDAILSVSYSNREKNTVGGTSAGFILLPAMCLCVSVFIERRQLMAACHSFSVCVYP